MQIEPKNINELQEYFEDLFRNNSYPYSREFKVIAYNTSKCLTELIILRNAIKIYHEYDNEAKFIKSYHDINIAENNKTITEKTGPV